MPTQLLVISEDREFSNRLLKEAARSGAHADWYSSFAELGRVGRLGDYDCVVADLSADPVTAIEVAQYATAFFSDLPVLLLSDDSPGYNRMTARRLPPAVQARIPKESGAAAVMRSALAMAAPAEARMVCPAMPRARATRYQMSA